MFFRRLESLRDSGSVFEQHEPTRIPRSEPEQSAGDSDPDAPDRRSRMVAVGVRRSCDLGLDPGHCVLHFSLVSLGYGLIVLVRPEGMGTRARRSGIAFRLLHGLPATATPPYSTAIG